MAVRIKEKKPVLAYELFFKYGGERGADSLRSPCGQPVRYALSLSNWLQPVVEPWSRILAPLFRGHIDEKKARTCVRAFSRIWR